MNKGYIAITFDDGFKTDLTVALQAQIDRGLDPKGTTYLVGSASTSSRLKDDEILQLFDHGWDIQSHTYSHTLGGPDGGITGMTPDEVREDIQLQHERFRNLGLPEPQHFAYPGGGNNEQIRDILQNYYKTMRDTQGRFMIPGVKRTNVPSFGFDVLRDDAELGKFLKRIDVCAKYNLAMTVFGHEFTTQKQIDNYGRFLDHCIDVGIKLVTISELYEIIK